MSLIPIDRPCAHCGHGVEEHTLGRECRVRLRSLNGEQCPCPQYEPDKVCSSHYPMPSDPAPHDYETWIHDWTFKGVDRERRKHSVCQNCGTLKIVDDEGDTAISAPGRVAPPPGPRTVSIEFGDRYAPNQLLVDAIEWTQRQPVTAAMVVLLIDSPPDEPGDDPTCQVLWSEADLAELTLMRQALDIKVSEQVYHRAIPNDEAPEEEGPGA